MRLLRWILAPLSPLYGATIRVRNRAFDTHPERATHLPVPVLSIGNLSSGGTGKTPLTLYLAEGLQAAGWSNVILSRGYGGRRDVDPMDVAPDSNPSQTGDEPLMMARRLGPGRVIVGRKRAVAGLRALGQNPRLLLLDDGFQHRALHRDVDLLLLDGVRRWGNGKTLPLGDLREPMECAQRAHALVVTRGARAPREEILTWWQRYGSGGPVFWIDFAIGSLRSFPDGSVPSENQTGPLFAFCALGHPEAFYADLILAGHPWVGYRSFRDHQAITKGTLQQVVREARLAGAEGLVCTEKDAVKLGPGHLLSLDFPLWVAQQQV
ncbi:MAG: tetraacyldisaccharide 4'-kinase, partial [Holophaga sp.]|nr:tetraacyldisaccharide 4'-kinase [Holophaga sp.]